MPLGTQPENHCIIAVEGVNNTSMDVNKILERSQHRVVQFACTMASKPSLKRKESEALRNYLSEEDPELFQVFEDPPPAPAGIKAPLLLATRQYSVGSLLAKAPSLILAPEAITITQVLRIGSIKTSGDDTLTNGVLNKKMRGYLLKIQELAKLRYTRVGKIFEFNFGPFNHDEKREVLGGLLVNPDGIVGLQTNITRLVKATDEMNVVTMLQFNQADPTQPFLLQVKIDVNNRNFKTNLDPKNIDDTFADADSTIQSHLEWLFGATP